MRPLSDVTGYLEHPVKGASSAFAILFFISSLFHIWQSSKYKSWTFTWLFPCACILFTGSFICREYMAFHPTSDATVTAIQGLFYSGVAAINFPLYLILPFLLSTLIPIRHIYVSIIYIPLTTAVISLIGQGTSSFFSPDAPDASVSSGLAELKACLIIQLFLNVASIAVLAILHRWSTSRGNFEQIGERNIRIAVISSCISITWILVRNLFCTIQIFLPPDSPAWKSEVYFWVFEATPMLACTIFLHILPPARYLRPKE